MSLHYNPSDDETGFYPDLPTAADVMHDWRRRRRTAHKGVEGARWAIRCTCICAFLITAMLIDGISGGNIWEIAVCALMFVVDMVILFCASEALFAIRDLE